MDIEQLAKEMRIAALDGYKILTGAELTELREETKKLYFNAGRWSAGAKDYTAREAFAEMNRREALENR